MNRFFQFRQNQLLISIMALLFAVSLSFLVYVHYFQPIGYSFKRATLGGFVFVFLFCIGFAAFRFVFQKYFGSDGSAFLRSIGFWLLVSLIFAPHILPIPHYPMSPLFQQTNELQITFRFPEGTGDPVQLKGVWLSFDDKKYSVTDFTLSDNWANDSGKYFIDPNEEGTLSWRGKVGERATLTIFSLDVNAKVTVIWGGEETHADLMGSPVSFLKKNQTPFWYYASITIARVILVGVLLLAFFNIVAKIENTGRRTGVIAVFLFSLGLLLVYAHFQSTDIKDKFDLQTAYHEAVLAGQAPSPWQYRLFSEWVLEGLIRLMHGLGRDGSFYFAAMVLRIIQNTMIYFLSYLYYRKLGYGRELALIGVVFLTGSMLNSFYKSGFSFNTYFDLVFYLAAGLLILNASFSWLPIVMTVAALNRETSGLVPFLALSMIAYGRNRKLDIAWVFLSLFCWVVVFLTLRMIYPDSQLFIPYESPPGLALLLYNLFPTPWALLLRFFSIVPILGMAVFRSWKPFLGRFFMVLIPIWLGVHLVASVIAETRLFLVPQVLVFIPLFLVFIERVKGAPLFSAHKSG